MRHLLNTLYVNSEDIYLSLDGETVVANREGKSVAQYPLHNFESIITFSYKGASPALMGACATRDIGLAFFTPRGRFLARASGEINGNVLLRRTQYRVADDPSQRCRIARAMILAKLYNARWSIERSCRDHKLRVDVDVLKAASLTIRNQISAVSEVTELDSLRGYEGVGAAAYFGVFDQMILNQKETFYFHSRNRRPPTDCTNALLSFVYSLLSHQCASALEGVGLDAYVGVFHTDRPGRISLALDLMEELRPCMADRFVLTLINNRVIGSDDFEKRESGAVYLNEDGRKLVLRHWQEKKKDTLMHPYLNEKLEWGMIPHIQALLLARYLRGDLDGYPPFLWK